MAPQTGQPVKTRLAWEQQPYQEAGKAGKLTLFTIAWHTTSVCGIALAR
jgi:hypothetical protein